MSDRWLRAWGTGAVCLAVGFAGGVWWASDGADGPTTSMSEGGAVPSAKVATSPAAVVAAESPVVVGSPVPVPVPGPAPVSVSDTSTSLGSVANDPQVALQLAAATSTSNARDIESTPLNRTDSNDGRVIDQRGMQPSQPALPESIGSATSAAPSQSSQIEAQTQAGH
jgi:hypothetical protein